MNRNLILRVCRLAALSILFGGTAAQAETIYLQCGQASFTVDLTNKTVNNKPASIDATSIDWNDPPQTHTRPDGGLDTVTLFQHIDRVQGTYSFRIQVEFPGGVNPGRTNTFSCTVGSAPATKF